MNDKIQSASLIVPPVRDLETGELKKCCNNCVYGVCFQNLNKYENRVMESPPGYKTYAWADYVKKLIILRDLGVDTIIITGDIEPLDNKELIDFFDFVNRYVLPSPFKKIELQTCGNNLDDKTLNWLRNVVGVTTISLSLSSYDNDLNAKLTNNKNPINIKELTQKCLDYKFIVRHSLNMSKVGFEPIIIDNHVQQSTAHELLRQAKACGAQQLTIRELYQDDTDNPHSKWVRKNAYTRKEIETVLGGIVSVGRKRGVLPFGASLYTCDGISVAVDIDCMSQDGEKEEIKYLVLGPDCILYRDWEMTIYA